MLATATALALFAASSSARADVIETCAEASEEAQARRDRGELRAARALLLTCAAAECPAVVQRDCASWLEDLDMRQPSILLRVRDTAGHERADVRVSIDGEERATVLDGRAISVDPGSRRVRVETQGFAPVEQVLQVRERERGRIVDLVLPSMQPRATPTPEVRASNGWHVPLSSWVLGGVAVAGGATFAIFGARAQGDVREMRGTCAPHCDADRVDAAKREALVANVALGAGVAALGTGVVLLFMSQPETSTPTTTGARSTLRLHLGHGAGPGLTLDGRF
ncbi:hypothetical protein [Chondromyces crocatus]|uniref:PEGA domain-containing protein n=1 Tax=Chondromyces crocatus TaxID=52 RepID=A0A0K1ED37_CHOCO|nr:hypothetical protein [Chondromyces crocatus]AKT38759.1 uncharacterized protein CMC5_029050 [Chondromyces crocatus]